MPLPIGDDLQQELQLLLAAADDFHAEPPGPTTSGEKHPSPDDDQNGNDSTAEDGESDPGNENQAGLEDQTPSDQQLFIRRLAKRLKLNNVQVTAVEKFNKETIGTKLLVLYGETISLLDKVNTLTENVGPASFKMTKEITDNIKLVVKQAFFNPAAKDYKTEDSVKLLVLIRHSLVGIPKNLEETNPQAWVQIESKVGYEVTQLRGSIKKVLKDDSKLDPGRQMKISALTKAVMGKISESDYQRFGVETFMRVALFRKVFLKHPSEEFWDVVDLWLDNMRKGGKTAYEKAMTGLISLDRATYGVKVVDSVAQ